MIETYTIVTFIITSFILTISPGPDIIFVITQGISQGKKSGVLTAIGLAFGNIIHLLGVSLGISVIFKTSEFVFFIFKILGALYLFYLAYQTIKNRNQAINIKQNKLKELPLLIISRGFIMNVLNPKVALFFLAFFPQFLNQSQENIALQMLLLGSIFIIIVLIVFGAFGFFAGHISRTILKHQSVTTNIHWLSAIIFIGLGLFLIFSKIA